MKTFSLCNLIILFCVVCGFAQTNGNVAFDEAAKLRKENKCEEAITKLSSAIETDVKNSWLYLERARCFKVLNNNEAVFDNVQTAFLLNPTDEKLLQSGEFELRTSGQSDKLVKLADALIANDKNNAIAYQIRSLNKFLIKDFIGAIDDHLKFTEIEPSLGYTRIGIVFDSLKKLRSDKNVVNQYFRATKFYEQILKELTDKVQFGKDNPVKKSRYEFAKSQYGTILQTLFINIADLLVEEGKADEAIDYLNRVVQIEPKAVGYSFRSNYFKQKGRYAEAINDSTIQIEIVGKATKNPKVLARLLIRRGDLYILAKDYERAITDFQSAVQSDKDVTSEATERIDLAKLELQKKPTIN